MSSSMNIVLKEDEQRLKDILINAARYYGKSQDKKVPILRFAGGWVRDKLLGKDSKDIDVAIDCMTGKDFYQVLKSYIDTLEPSNTNPTVLGKLAEIKKDAEKSKHLETVNTKLFGLDLDIVNLRTETYSDDSRNPIMRMGTAEEDAMRRDATINAMFYNLNTGEVEDLTGHGRQDLERCLLRTPMDAEQTFLDDPLRMLRLIRFASRFGFTIDSDALISMKIPKIQIQLEKKISRERMLVEFKKMMNGPDPHKALGIIISQGLYDRVFTIPGVADGLLEPADTSLVEDCCKALELLIKGEGDYRGLGKQLLPTKEDKVMAWTIVALQPWIGRELSQQLVRKGSPATMAARTARDGLKMDNVTIRVLSDVDKYAAEFSEYCKAYEKQARTEPESPSTKRKRTTIDRVSGGLAIKRWGPHWRSIATTALLTDVARANATHRTDILDRYRLWLDLIAAEKLTDVWNTKLFKPIVDGKIITQFAVEKLGEKVAVGPWMQEVVARIFEYQLRQQEEATVDGAKKVVHDAIDAGEIKVTLKGSK